MLKFNGSNVDNLFISFLLILLLIRYTSTILFLGAIIIWWNCEKERKIKRKWSSWRAWVVQLGRFFFDEDEITAMKQPTWKEMTCIGRRLFLLLFLFVLFLCIGLLPTITATYLGWKHYFLRVKKLCVINKFWVSILLPRVKTKVVIRSIT